jgi:hypothetical protein
MPAKHKRNSGGAAVLGPQHGAHRDVQPEDPQQVEHRHWIDSLATNAIVSAIFLVVGIALSDPVKKLLGVT